MSLLVAPLLLSPCLGNERRNTLATFNRPALSCAYTYLANPTSGHPHLHPPMDHLRDQTLLARAPLIFIADLYN